MKEYNYSNIALFMAFTLLAAIGIFNHEIWLDEAQNWLQARDNNSISELYSSLRYEGHPILWNLLLFLITRFTHNVIWMQVLHLSIITMAIAIFIFHAPFKFHTKALFVFGYFVFYEYALISRNYSLIILFLFIIAWRYSKHQQNYISLFLLLALLANTHLLGLIISISVGSYLGIKAIREKAIEHKSNKLIIGATIFSVGIIFSIIQIIPPHQTPIVLSSFSFVESISRVVPVFVKAFIPIPDILNYRFWNTNLIISASKPLASFLSIILFFLPAVFLNKKKLLLLIFYACTVLIFCVFVVIKLPAVRYAGIIYIFFMFCLWISNYENDRPLLPVDINQSFLDKLLTGLLAIQLLAGVIAYSLEIIRPFSESKHVALYLQKENLLNLDVLGEFCESAVFLTYIDKQSFYLDLKNYGSYCHLKEGEAVYDIDLNTMLAEADAYTRQHKADALFIHYKPIPLNLPNAQNLVLLKSFTNSILNNENFYVYRVLYKP